MMAVSTSNSVSWIIFPITLSKLQEFKNTHGWNYNRREISNRKKKKIEKNTKQITRADNHSFVNKSTKPIVYDRHGCYKIPTPIFRVAM